MHMGLKIQIDSDWFASLVYLLIQSIRKKVISMRSVNVLDFMPFLDVCSQMGFLCSLVVTLITSIFDPLMHGLNVYS